MGLGQYLELIRSRRLWFSAARHLGDPWEGALFGTRKTIEGIDPADLNDAAAGYRHRRKVTCISCWHSAERESAAMWNHYGNEGVVVRADPMSVAYGSAIPTLDELHHAFGAVHYIDHSEITEFPKNYMSPFFAKRVAFASEREIRIAICDDVAFDDAKNDGGISLEVNCDELISEVRVSPDAPRYLLDVVRAATGALGCSRPVNRSELSPQIQW